MTRSPHNNPERNLDRNPNCRPEPGDAVERSLTDFLQTNAPTPPPADPALRSQILTEIANRPHVGQRQFKAWWLVPPAVAAAVSASWLWPRPVVLTADERLELETYLVASHPADQFRSWYQPSNWIRDRFPTPAARQRLTPLAAATTNLPTPLPPQREVPTTML